MKNLKKFIPFVKLDEAKRQVWGIVTAELPDKDDEVCDYLKSKPFYEKVIRDMSKATNGGNLFPLREMHQLSAVGKCIGFEFRDDEKEIFMGFEVVDDDAWNKVKKQVYTGFSQGGRCVGDMLPDPIYKGCNRYVADPIEASLVDNPCLPTARITVIKSDGSIEIHKFKHVEEGTFVSNERLNKLLDHYDEDSTHIHVKKGDAKTKRVAGEDLSASAFLIVGDKDKTDTWKLPVKFSSDAKSKSHIRNAIARFDQLKSVSQSDKDAAWKKLVSMAKQYGIDVAEEKVSLSEIHKRLKKAALIATNRNWKTVSKCESLIRLDFDLNKLSKGMYEVSRLASYVQGLGDLLYCVVAEQEWEEDEESALPDMIAENVDSLMEALVAMVAEETSELRDQIEARVG